MEYEDGVAHPNLVAGNQKSLTYGHAADESVVAAFEIDKTEVVGLLANYEVAARYQRVERRDVIGGLATDRNLTLNQRKTLPFNRPLTTSRRALPAVASGFSKWLMSP